MNFSAFLANIKRFRDDRGGATAVEYGLIVALVSVVIIGAVSVAGVELNQTFAFIGETLKNA